jgi:hypothetical protein
MHRSMQPLFPLGRSGFFVPMELSPTGRCPDRRPRGAREAPKLRSTLETGGGPLPLSAAGIGIFPSSSRAVV